MSILTGTLTALAIMLGRVLRYATRNPSALIRAILVPAVLLRRRLRASLVLVVVREYG